MVHIRSRKHRRSHHKRSKYSRTRGTRARRGGTGTCWTCGKQDCKTCARLSMRLSAEIRAERLAAAAARKAAKEAELAKVMAERKSAYIEELRAALKKAQDKS